ncbi:MAG TPA: DinB family protein [Bryobacteraceae bacterium]
MPISEMLLPEFDQEMANTRKVLERYPEGKNEYKPHEKSMPLGRLAGHVATLPEWATMTMTTESLNFEPGEFKPFIPTTRQELLETFDRHVAAARAHIAAASDEALGVTWTVTMSGKPMMSMPRASVLRGMVMNHLIHHRAQLGVYFRLNGVAIPGMYGPSADEPLWDVQAPGHAG